MGAGERMPHASAGDRMPRFFPSTDRLEGEVNDYSISGICDEDEEEARKYLLDIHFNSVSKLKRLGDDLKARRHRF